MSNAWDERKKALENEYFHKKEKEIIEKMKHNAQESLVQNCCKNRCPKCGDKSKVDKKCKLELKIS